MTRRPSTRQLLALTAVLALMLAIGGEAVAQKAGRPPILSGPLAKLDIKDAQVETARGKSKGTLIVAQHFALDPGWLDPQEHIFASEKAAWDEISDGLPQHAAYPPDALAGTEELRHERA